MHANCGGYTTAQYTKICKENIWVKCLICCIQNIQLAEADDDSPSRISTAIEVARSRITESSSSKVPRKKSDRKSVPSASKQYTDIKDSTSCTPNISGCNKVVDTESEIKSEPCITGIKTLHNNVGTNCIGTDKLCFEDNSIELSQKPDTDNILIVVDIDNAIEFSSSRRILNEIHNFFPHIKVDFAYSLAKGGVAIHTTCKSDRDLLLEQLPAESFGRGTKYLPKGHCAKCIYLKGVDTSIDIGELSDQLKRKGIQITEGRRLTNRYTGKPTQIVKVSCAEDSANFLLATKLTINNKTCSVEREREVRVIRCYNCQRFGHLAKFCTNPRCDLCGEHHSEQDKCKSYIHCVNCSGCHPAFSSHCPVYVKRYADLAEQHSKCNHIATTSATYCTQTGC